MKIDSKRSYFGVIFQKYWIYKPLQVKNTEAIHLNEEILTNIRQVLVSF